MLTFLAWLVIGFFVLWIVAAYVTLCIVLIASRLSETKTETKARGAR